MISLGFFRILELEINERLLKKAITDDLVIELEQAVDAMEKSMPLPELRSRSQQKLLTYWKNTSRSIARISEGGSHALEFGPTEILLNKLKSKAGADSDIKASLSNALQQHLTASGR